MVSMRLRYFLGALLWAFASCGPGGGSGASVRLSVETDPSWSIDRLVVEASGRRVEADPAPALRVLVPDAWVGQEVTLRVVALRTDDPWAAGSVVVVPESGREVQATVVLARVPCGAWCSEGATACEADGVVRCEQRDDDACFEWSEPVPCPGGMPFCSLGACGAE
jgi:hypothetical protein